MKINKEIKAARKSKGLLQSEMARRLGITDQAYSMYETGERTPVIGMAAKIAEAMGMKFSVKFE